MIQLFRGRLPGCVCGLTKFSVWWLLCGQAGEKLSDLTVKSKSSCIPCKDDTYMLRDQSTHDFVDACKPQRTCSKGQKIVNNTKTTQAECVDCEDFTYWLTDGERPTSCLKQAKCDPTEFISTLDLDKKGACTICGVNTYTTATNQALKCDEQPKCKAGQKLVGATKSTRGTCTACGSGQFQEDENYQGTMPVDAIFPMRAVPGLGSVAWCHNRTHPR